MKKLKNSELNRISIDEYKAAEKTPFIVVLDNIRSQSNIGSVFRTSDCFRLEAVYLCGITAQPPHREIQKTALGSTESVHWKYFNSIIDAILDLKNKGYQVYAIEQAEGSYKLGEFTPDFSKKCAFIFGNEVKGVQQEAVNISDACIEIPQYGTKHSLNISISVGIVLWEMHQKLIN
ncbi:MAG: RNA methyltransferase [Bacteroidales bacterium]|jgi:23S rRNA (guanosine2251-2'-O)-methyltransferase|nr:RNA methyltransferase [Bacteroidales bacterium]